MAPVFLLASGLSLLSPSLLRAGITVDQTSDSGDKTSVSTFNWSHTVGSGLSNSILIVGYGGAGASGTSGLPISTLTYGSNSLTQAVFLTETGAGNRAEIWYLLNPPAGTNTITVTLLGTATTARAGAISLSGVNPATPTDGTNSGTGQSLSITTTVDNDWIVDCASVGTANGGRLSGFGAGQTAVFPASGTDPQGMSYSGPDSPAGSQTVSFTSSGFTQQAYVAVAFQSAAGVGGANATVTGGAKLTGQAKVQ
jgi:hypothetical protein